MYTVKELIEALKECPEDYKVLLVTDKPYEIGMLGVNLELKTVDLFSK